MDPVKKALIKFGLSLNEAKIYQEALKYEETSPYSLSKITKIPRTTVYEIIMSLALKGLVELEKSDGITKQQTKIRAKNPSEMRKILQKKRSDLMHTEVDIVGILPLLKADYQIAQSNSDFAFYPGIEGARKVYLSETNEEIDLPVVAWDYQVPMDAFGTETINKDIEKAREFKKKAKYKSKELMPLNDWTRHVMSYQYGRDPSYIDYIEHRFIDSPIFNFKQRLSVKGSRIRITSIEEGESWGLIINSPSLAKSLESLFYILWQTATPITHELIKSWGESEYLKAERKAKINA